MSLTSKLLEMDAGIFSKESHGEVEIKRLSKIIGEPFIVKCKALSGNRFMEFSSIAVTPKGKVDYSKAYDSNLQMAVAGIVEPNLKDKELMKHYGCATPKELVEKLFIGGEVTKIGALVTELSGYGDDAEEEIKN